MQARRPCPALVAAVLLIALAIAPARSVAQTQKTSDRARPGPASQPETTPAPPRAGQVMVEPKSGLGFIALPGGTFHMGCEPQDSGCYDDEKPGRTVTVRHSLSARRR
jgi:formylglycine-generating enzyme required for sulfatase activity